MIKKFYGRNKRKIFTVLTWFNGGYRRVKFEDLPATRSSISAGARKTRIEDGIVYEQYPKLYGVEGLYENLKFAMRYEPIDLGVCRAAFEKIDKQN